MSTDTRSLQNPAPRPARDEEPAKPKTDLSATQVLAGALAAMTAAYLGSRLSVAGTVAGAAVASVVAAVAGSIYTASLRSTHQRVRTVFQGRVAGSTLPARVEQVADRDTRAVEVAPGRPGVPEGDGVTSARGGFRLSWRNVLVAALAAFALAGITLTGLELATGSALSGGKGTTVGRVVEPSGAADPVPAPSPSAEPSHSSPSAAPSATADPSEPATAAPSRAPETTPEATPAPQPEPSTEVPTPTAPSTSSSAPSAEPTPSASSTADGTAGDEG